MSADIGSLRKLERSLTEAARVTLERCRGLDPMEADLSYKMWRVFGLQLSSLLALIRFCGDRDVDADDARSVMRDVASARGRLRQRWHSAKRR